MSFPLVHAEVFIEDENIIYESDEAWSYYGPSPSFDSLSNNHNLVILGSPEEVEDALRNDVNEGWSEADGTERYAKINEEWVLSSYQLERGHYFTTRHHLRGYKASNMTLVQAHQEHFDWFSVRHRVESNSQARIKLEEGLRNQGFELERAYSNGFAVDSDGWLTIALLASIIAVIKKKHAKKLGDYIFPIIGFLLLLGFVRLGGVGLYSFLTPHQVFAVLSPVIFIGMPVFAFAYGRNRKGVLPGILVFTGFIAAVVVDYLFLGVEVIETEVVIQRFVAGLSLGIIAVSDLENKKKIIVLGLGLWAVISIMSLFVI